MKNNYIKTTLKNGVRLYLYLDKNMKKSFVSYGVFYGSSGEYSDFYLDGVKHHVLPGCAHFLEHLLLEHSKYGHLYRKFAQKKYVTNAGTSMDCTNYFFIGVDDVLESISELINAVDDPVFTSEDVVKTSEAIVEETKMGRDNMYRVASCIVDRNIFSGVEIVDETYNVLGDENTTKKINKDMLKLCYDAYYNDDNKVLLVAGNFDYEEIVSYIESVYESIPRHENRRESVLVREDEIRCSYQEEYMPTSEDYVCFSFKNKIEKYSVNEIKYFMLFLMENKFGSDTAFVEDMKKENIISQIRSMNFGKRLDYMQCYLGAFSSEVQEYVSRVLEELKNNSFSIEDFELFKRKYIAANALYMDKKYDVFKSFMYRLYCTDDFDDVDFIRNLDFDRFLEFYESLSFDYNTTAVIKAKKL